MKPEAGHYEALPEYPGYAGYPGSTPTSVWRRYFVFLREKWWVPLLTVAIAVCGAALYLALQPAAYASVARMWVSGKLHIPESSLYSEELQFFFGTQIELFQSEKIQQRALTRLQTLNPGATSAPVRIKITQAPKSAEA